MTDQWNELNLRMERAFQNQRLASEARSLRDHFAAAALTGLLSNVQRYQNEPLTRQAFEIADFMLRERERTNLDASPEAIADLPDERPPNAVSANGGTPCAASRDGSGTGDTQEPVAWAVVYPNDEVAVIAFKRQDADERATASDSVVPLYRQPQPTLTDAEMEAIADAADRYAALAPESAETVATLRGLLERLG